MKRAEAELLQARAAAEAASRAKSEFLATMSHELRTPLNAVLGFSQLLATGELQDRQRANVDQILTAGRHLLSLLQARRDWSGEELADRLGVSVRTVRRDVERLRTLGYPVDSLTGRAGGYRLHAGAALPPLLLDDDEAVAIAVGLRTPSWDFSPNTLAIEKEDGLKESVIAEDDDTHASEGAELPSMLAAAKLKLAAATADLERARTDFFRGM